MLFYAVLWAMRSNYLFRTWLGYDVWCEPVFFIHSNFIGSNTVTVPISIPISAMDLSQLEVGEFEDLSQLEVGEFDRVVKRRKRLLEADTTADELNKEKTDTEADELDLGNETDTKADELNKEKTDTETDFGAPTIPRRQTWEYNEACGDCNDAGEPVNELEKYNLLHKDDEFPDTPTDELDLENETDTKTDELNKDGTDTNAAADEEMDNALEALALDGELEGSDDLERYNLLHKDDEFPNTATDELDLENETDTKTDIKADELNKDKTAPSIRETLAEFETVALRNRLLAIKTTTDPVPNLAPPPADPDDPPSDNPLLAAVYYAHLKEEKRALDAVMMPPPQSKRGRSS